MESTKQSLGRSNRLVLFPPRMDTVRRRRRTIFFAVCVVIALLLIWPVYSFFAGPFPLILGLPLSLAWVVLALTLMFLNLLWLFRADSRDRES